MPIEDWSKRFQVLQQACERQKATGRWASGKNLPAQFEIRLPATQAEIAVLESNLGIALPKSLSKVLTTYSANVFIEWQFPDETRASRPEVFQQIWAGECIWSLDNLASMYKKYAPYSNSIDENDKLEGVWKNKFPVFEVANGDLIAIDISRSDHQPVVYLDHELCEPPCQLGNDFEDFIDRLTLLGCVGAEIWQLGFFLSDQSLNLETTGNNAKLWREWFGLDSIN